MEIENINNDWAYRKGNFTIELAPTDMIIAIHALKNTDWDNIDARNLFFDAKRGQDDAFYRKLVGESVNGMRIALEECLEQVCRDNDAFSENDDIENAAIAITDHLRCEVAEGVTYVRYDKEMLEEMGVEEVDIADKKRLLDIVETCFANDIYEIDGFFVEEPMKFQIRVKKRA